MMKQSVQVSPSERLIVALDVPTSEDAIRLVDELDNVSFFKVGWQLFIAGGLPDLLRRLAEKKIFVDLKVPGDIGNTISAVVDLCMAMSVKFLTLSDYVPSDTIKAARGKRGDKADPKLLMVPYLSSLDASDLLLFKGPNQDLDAYILERAEKALTAGCDGFVASGQAIGLLRENFKEQRPLIVSPAIRRAGTSANDHKRFTTPTQAIRLGADYLVVGRPVRNAPDPRDAAQKIIDEIEAAFDEPEAPSSHSRAQMRASV